ncbi:TPA: RHS repeat-associated core domain-containing protein, partial [Pseudomonas aeruginosa]
NLRFPGQYYDAESGLHYNYFRDYDPETGRYVETDPIGLEGGINTYGYVGANPVGNIDPLGLQTAILCPRVTIGFEGMTAGCPGGVPRPSPVGGAVNTGGMGTWCVLTGTCSANESESEDCPPTLPNAGSTDHADQRSDEAKSDAHRQVGDKNKIIENGKKYYDNDTGNTVHVDGDRVVVTDSNGTKVTQFKNTRANTNARVRSGRWTPL